MNKNYHLPRLNRQSFYTNPAAYTEPGTIPTNPDPYVIKFNGIYYCYSTDENGVNVSSSENLTVWKFLGRVAKEEDKHDYWAPCVIYDNGTFYLYCSNTGISTKDNHQEYLQLYTAASPEGPFTYVKTFFQKFSIDAHVVRDYDGTVYLFYSVNDYMGTDEYRPGTSILVDRLIHFTELAGEEKPVVTPSIKEEMFEENRFGDERDWYTVEGAFFLRRHNRAYLLYAANAYVRENYYLGYSFAEGNTPIPDISWQKYPSDHTYSPLVCRNKMVEGTGHCSVIQAPNLTDDWIIYHGRNQDRPLTAQTEEREMRLDPLYYSGCRLLTNAPSYEAQDCPEPPAYSCFGELDRPDFQSTEQNGIVRKILNRSFENYVMEWDIVGQPTHMGARYGILLSYLDHANYIELLFDSGRRSVTVIEETNHFKKTISSYRLSAVYNHEVSHHIRVLRNYSHFMIYLDGILILEPMIDTAYGKVGFVTRYTSASPAFFAVTEHTGLYGRDLFWLSKIFRSSEPLLFDTAVHCMTKAPAVLEEIKPARSYKKSIECNLLSSASFLRADLYEQDQRVLSILVKGGIYLIVGYEGGHETVVAQCPYTEKNFTLYFTQKGNKTALYLEHNYYAFQRPADRSQTLRLTAYEIEIVGYETSSLAGI